jgi:hypothetical protein
MQEFEIKCFIPRRERDYIMEFYKRNIELAYSSKRLR